ILAANGGAGGGGNQADLQMGYGDTGGFGITRAAGGTPGAMGGAGGRGGAAGSVAGEDGKNGGQGGGGAGGACGRIRLQSRTGTATIDGAAQLSPRLSDNLATQGMVDLR